MSAGTLKGAAGREMAGRATDRTGARARRTSSTCPTAAGRATGRPQSRTPRRRPLRGGRPWGAECGLGTGREGGREGEAGQGAKSSSSSGRHIACRSRRRRELERAQGRQPTRTSCTSPASQPALVVATADCRGAWPGTRPAVLVSSCRPGAARLGCQYVVPPTGLEVGALVKTSGREKRGRSVSGWPPRARASKAPKRALSRLARPPPTRPSRQPATNPQAYPASTRTPLRTSPRIRSASSTASRLRFASSLPQATRACRTLGPPSLPPICSMASSSRYQGLDHPCVPRPPPALFSASTPVADTPTAVTCPARIALGRSPAKQHVVPPRPGRARRLPARLQPSRRLRRRRVPRRVVPPAGG